MVANYETNRASIVRVMLIGGSSFLILVLFVLGYLIFAEARTNTEQAAALATRLTTLDGTQVAAEKVRQDTAQVSVNTQQVNSLRGILSAFAPFITALVAVIGVVLTLWKQMSDSAQQRVTELHQREAERIQRANEGQQRVDEKFTALLSNLTDEHPAAQASAIVSLTTFLDAKYETYHDQIFRVIVAQLKLRDPADLATTTLAVNRLLVSACERAIRARIQALTNADRAGLLDFVGAWLEDIDLSALDLRDADLAFARMPGANLAGTNLYRAKGYAVNLTGASLVNARLDEARMKGAICDDANFSGARLVSAKFREASFQRARFLGASLQSAHLMSANLRGARFKAANVHDTFFQGAIFDDAARRSLVQLDHWRAAWFSPDERARLEQIATSP